MFNWLKSALKRAEPRVLKERRAKRHAESVRAARARANMRRSSAEIFAEIYTTNAWGGERGEYFSGTGSAGSAASAYVTFVNRFIADRGIRSVVDLGCGDYRIGRQLEVETYTGIDVAAPVCAFNTERFGSPNRTFINLDAAADGRLPAAELCLVRQVLQHLSNAQISLILQKLAAYRYVLVTEHYPAAEDYQSANRDIVHGQDTRLFIGSGVYLDKPPFEMKAELVLECTDSSGTGIYARGPIRTYLVSAP